MNCYKVPPLSEEEEKLPVARFYRDYPLYRPSPLQQQIIDQGPMNPEKAIRPTDWLSLLEADQTPEIVFGWCMLEDGSGYYIEYSVTPETIKPGMRRWYGTFYNRHSKNMDSALTPNCGKLVLVICISPTE